MKLMVKQGQAQIKHGGKGAVVSPEIETMNVVQSS